jgi:uncharacterized protein YjbJ (UPF0337 family)
MAEVQEQVQEKAEEAKEQVKEATGEARDQARSRVRGEVDRRSTEVGQQVSDAADAMRRVSETLREEGKDGPARAADQAAERAQRAGSWLQESDADRILREVEDFGRRKPWAMALGGLVLGIGAARFLKASSGDRYRSQSGTSASGNGNGAPHRNGNADEPAGLTTGLQTDAPAVPVGAAPPTTPLDAGAA